MVVGGKGGRGRCQEEGVLAASTPRWPRGPVRPPLTQSVRSAAPPPRRLCRAPKVEEAGEGTVAGREVGRPPGVRPWPGPAGGEEAELNRPPFPSFAALLEAWKLALGGSAFRTSEDSALGHLVCDQLCSWATIPTRVAAGIRLALYVYEYLLHVGAQKSAQTFLSEIRWEKNITLGEPPGFLHSWWCVFWDLYCAAPDRREACEHSSEAKAFQDYSTAAAPSPVMGSLAPNDAMAPGFFQPFMSPRFPGGPRPTLRMPSQPPVGLTGSQPLLPGAMDPTPRAQGHPSMGGPMQRVTPPRGMAGVGPQSYGGSIRPLPSPLTGPGLPTLNMGPAVRGPWASPSGNSVCYSSASPGSYTGPPGGGPPGTPILASPGDSNSSESMYTIMNPIGPPGRANVSADLLRGGGEVGSGLQPEGGQQLGLEGQAQYQLEE
ncbi:single-stranded DNA-binding protein 4 [Echinops telfairi]|uniref:Single-stranded DNA-binding protein 4 n=1 Tax=Echinops telfairi TaxID=9371 RepID=A0AC55DTW2_ECHTE|nr:single-stranded DNA-binding protein 4 [Echinops telfairi]